MSNYVQESKKLALEIKANESKYVSGELDLNPVLDKTDELYKLATSSSDISSASAALQDSNLMQLQTKIARQCAKSYAVDKLTFDPRAFSIKIRNDYCPKGDSANKEDLSSVWEKLGKCSLDKMYTCPNFSFISGTFDAAPVESLKKQRKRTEKDKVGLETKPEKVNANSVNGQDVMLEDAQRVFSIFLRLAQRSEKHALCYYEFVTDPESFTRTIENIFLVSLLIKEGHLCIFDDEQGLPFLRSVTQTEQDTWTTEVKQSVISIGIEEWEEIVKTFNIKTASIPPRRVK